MIDIIPIGMLPDEILADMLLALDVRFCAIGVHLSQY